MAQSEIKLKVAEAIQDDVNKGILRVDSGYMQEISVRPGDIIEIEGERKTVGIVDRSYPGDIGLNIIRMDGIARKNAKTGIGEVVSVRKADVKEAKKVLIAPARKDVVIKASPEIFKQGLLGRAVTKGDIVSLGGARKRRTTMTENPFFDDIFNMLDETNMVGFGFSDIKFVVADTNPKQAVIISEKSEVVFNPQAIEIKDEYVPEVSYEDVGGLSEEIKKVREMVELPLKHPEIFERLGIEAPKGVLLHGPPGTGKTLLAKAIANETNSHFVLINGPEIMSKYYGQSEENLRKKFDEAEKNAPAIIFIDEVDAIASKREETRGEVERRVVAQLLALMDGLKSRGKVVVIAATNVPNILDPALRRPGRFDREIDIGVPDQAGRLNILKIHTRNMPLATNIDVALLKSELNKSISQIENHIYNFKSKHKVEGVKESSELGELEQKKKNLVELKNNLKSIRSNKELKNFLSSSENNQDRKNMIYSLLEQAMLSDIAEVTYGFVGADLSSLAKEAAMIVLRKLLPDLRLKEEEQIPKEVLEKLKVTQSDFKEALKFVRPSAMREVLVETPNIKWEDIGGLGDVKQELIEAVEWPLKFPDSFKRMGVSPPKGILLYGAPGTGKTLLAKAVATESKANFILVKGPELLSKWVGESEKAVREVFKKARQVSPTIIFFDEIDSLTPRRGMDSGSHVTESVVNQLLTEIDGLESLHDVVLIAASNRPDIIDTALLRPGRFDRMILTPPPDEKSRLEIFKVHTKSMPLKGVSLEALAKKTEGYAGADIESICREAAIFALRKDINAKEVTSKHFSEALDKVRPSITKEIDKAYSELQNHFKAARGKQMKEEMPSYMG